MPRKSTTALADPAPASSKLLQCSAHGQTLSMVRDRWDRVALMERADVIDVTFCDCCSSPAKYPGVSAMTFEEIDLISPRCSRCHPMEATA